MLLIAYKGKTRFFDRLIQWWTKSPYSHCELVLSDGKCYSSSILDGGVRSTYIQYENSPKWDIYHLPDNLEINVSNYFARTRGMPYGFIDLIFNQIIKSNRDYEAGEFCSSWCAAAIGLPSSSNSYSPGSLVDFIKYIYADINPD